MIDFIALCLWSLFLSAAAGGLAIVLRVRGRRRWAGLGVAALGAAAAALLAFMSSKYWFGEQVFYHAFIDVETVALLRGAATTALALALGAGVVVAAALALRTRLAGRRWWVALSAAAAALLALGAAGTGGLVALSVPQYNQETTQVDRPIVAAPGFAVALYTAERMRSPTALTFGPDGRLYVADIPGHIWAIPPKGEEAGPPALFAEGFREPLGLAWRGDTLFVASLGRISAVRDADGDGAADERREIVTGLPVHLFPLHQNNGIAFGPDGRLYFGLGATDNDAVQRDPRTAAILSVNPDGSDLRVFARGLRNAYDVAFNAAGDLFATDNGPQGLPVIPGDELNHIREGRSYGYPFVYDMPPPDSPVVAPTVIFAPHASPAGLAFYEARGFPPEYRGNAFVASWMRGELYRVQLAKAGDTYMAHASVFASGMLNPIDVAVGADGCLFVADYGVSAVYRICRAPGA